MLAALMLATLPAKAQNSRLDIARQSYVACAELAAIDEFVQNTPDTPVHARAERALMACATEEAAYQSIMAAQFAAFGNAGNSALINARAIAAEFKAKLKQKLVIELLDAEIKSHR
jgi:hypothetical protein